MTIRRRRERALVVVLAFAAALTVVVILDASARAGAVDVDGMTRVARATGLSDLALSSSSRWLRHPSLAEPSAAAWDAPIGLDVDPAGATIPRRAR
jgi:hypothetical protein